LYYYIAFVNGLYEGIFNNCIFSTMTGIINGQSTGKYANINGLKMYYEVQGKGFPLVLIHGGGSTIGTTFGRIIQRL
jgi:hypothetical protein